MKFHLRTLLALVTVTCIFLAVSLSIIHHRDKLRKQRSAFQNVDDNVSLLDHELHQHILQMPAVLAQLKKANPIDPPMALGKSITGESRAFGTFEFRRTFQYDWQLPDGSRSEGIKVTVDSVLKEDSLDCFVVRLTCETSELNDEIATWIAGRLSQVAHVKVRHVKLPKTPLVPRKPESEEDVSSQGWSNHFGIR